ncbi:hypothetical protein ACFLYS_01730 [Chloroflexota bacterium]
MSGTIGVPGTKTMKSAFIDFAVGAGGGLIYGLSRAIFGSSFIGALVAPVLAGSMVKGERGTALATVAGFLSLAGAFESSSDSQPSAAVSTQQSATM